MSLVALVNTENHLFVRREPLIWTQISSLILSSSHWRETLSCFVALRG